MTAEGLKYWTPDELMRGTKCVLCDERSVTAAAHIPVCEKHFRDYEEEGVKYLPHSERPVYQALLAADEKRRGLDPRQIFPMTEEIAAQIGVETESHPELDAAEVEIVVNLPECDVSELLKEAAAMGSGNAGVMKLRLAIERLADAHNELVRYLQRAMVRPS